MELQKRYQRAVDEFMKRVLEKYRNRVDDIILFGSVARGEAKEDSDIDILIVTKQEDYRLRRALIGIAFDILLSTGENISVKTLSKDEFERQKNFSFMKDVVSTGVKVA